MVSLRAVRFQKRSEAWPKVRVSLLHPTNMHGVFGFGVRKEADLI